MSASNHCKTKTRIVSVPLDVSALTPAQLDALFGTLTVSAGPDGDPLNASSTASVGRGERIHFFSSDGTLNFTVTDGSALVDVELNPTVLAGIAHTAITGIDLQPTANVNEFTVQIQWTDADGNAQTTTDPTPITVAGAKPNAFCAGPYELHAFAGTSGLDNTADISWIPTETGTVTMRYRALEIRAVAQPGSAGVAVGTSLGASDLVAMPFNGPERLGVGDMDKTVSFAVVAGQEVFFRAFAGGAESIVDGLEFCVAGQDTFDVVASARFDAVCTQVGGTLRDGVAGDNTYIITDDGNVNIAQGTELGDFRLDQVTQDGTGVTTFTFNRPVTVQVARYRTADVATVWHELAGSGRTRLVSDGSDWVYVAGNTPIQIDLLGQTVEAQTGAAGVPINDFWGYLTSENVTTLQVHSLALEGFNIRTMNAEVRVCDLIEGLRDTAPDVAGLDGVVVNAVSAMQDIPVVDPATGEPFAISIQDNSMGFGLSGFPVIGDTDSDCYDVGDTALVLPSVRTVPGAPILFGQPDDAPDTVDWVISPNVTLRRGATGGFYNSAAGQTAWAGPGPTGTLWRNDTNATPIAFQNAYDGAIGDNITLPSYGNAYITDTVTGTEYGPFDFVAWQAGGGGGFSIQTGVGPELIEPVWNVSRLRPKAVKANGNVQVRAAAITGEVGEGSPTDSFVSRFGEGAPIGGQLTVDAGSVTTISFSPVLMDRLAIAGWADIANSGDMTITLRDQFGGSRVVNYAWSYASGGTVVTDIETFAPIVANEVEVVVNNGTFRAGRIAPLIEATHVDMGLYADRHDRVSVVNDDDAPMFLSGVVGIDEVPAQSAVGVVRCGEEWFLEGVVADSDFRFLNPFQDFDVRTVNANVTQSVIVAASDGGMTVTYGSNANPQTIELADGENAAFSHNNVSGWVLTSYQADTPDYDPCDINEYIHRLGDYHLSFAHEGDGGTFFIANVNGVDVTYENLQNASDAGAGRINLNGGVNGVYNRRGSTIEAIREIGDYFEITKPGTPQFDSEWVTISTNPTAAPNTAADEYRLFFNEAVWQLRDRTNAIVANGAPENGVFRITRTLRGFELQVNGVVQYESPRICTNYNVVQPDWITNAPGAAGQVLTANGDGTATWV